MILTEQENEMAKIKYYKVVEAGSAEELQQMVNNCIDAGFEPIGGVSVCVLHTAIVEQFPTKYAGYTYSQAVVDYHDA